jgi:hypothetical protein
VRVRGWIVRSHIETEMTGTATVEGSPMGPMEIPMTSKIVTTTERLCLAGVVAVLLAGCAPAEPPVPAIEPFDVLVPDVRLGIRLADLQRTHAGLAIHGNGMYWEAFRDYDVTYGFWPKESDRPPPLSARLLSLEAEQKVHDTLNLWPAWQERVADARARLAVAPTCALLTGGRTTLALARFPGPVLVGVAAEISRGEDGQSFRAFLKVRATLPEDTAPERGGMAERAIDCRESRPW